MTTEEGREGQSERGIAKNIALTGPANQTELARIMRLRDLADLAPGSNYNMSLVVRRADNLLNKPLALITPEEGLRLMEYLKKLPGRHGKPTSKVVHMRSVLLRAYLKEVMGLQPDEKLPRDLDRATYIPKPDEKDESGVALTDDQFRRLIDASVRLFRGHGAARKATEFASMLWTDWDGGPRGGELLSLNVEEVDLRGEMAGMLYVREARRGHRLKTGPREIPITACVPALRLWLEKHPGRNDPNAPLFPAFTDSSGLKGMEYSVWYKMVRKAAVLSGVDAELPPGMKLRPHDLRHTSATNDAAAGDAVLRKKHGWSTKSSMPGHYTSHLTSDKVLSQMQELTVKRFGLPTVPVGAAPLHGGPTPAPTIPPVAPGSRPNPDAANVILDALAARLALSLTKGP